MLLVYSVCAVPSRVALSNTEGTVPSLTNKATANGSKSSQKLDGPHMLEMASKRDCCQALEVHFLVKQLSSNLQIGGRSLLSRGGISNATV